ncbi:MAG: UTP--glucose-1-phosphate uridylyltransferase GalU [Rickettsiales bacterium]|nr:UTP--glucose-1-phosphate uridylyltransferase GalU [Rickettsiales bacterium]
MKNKKVKTIVFPVGGFGTRFLPATKATPKEMLPVGEKPLIQYAFEEAMGAGIERFIFITGRNKNSIENHFDNNFELQTVLSDAKKNEMLKKTVGWLPPAGQIIFMRQQQALGLGHAILCAEKFVGNEPFAVTLADELFYKKDVNILKEMINIYENIGEKCNLVAIQEVEHKDVSKYGIISPEKDFGQYLKLNDMVEKPKQEEALSNLSMTGKYIFEPEIFNYIKQVEAGAGGEIQITDAMKKMLKDYSAYAYKMDGERFDCGSLAGYLKANIAFALNNNETRENTEKIIEEFYNKIKK